jgi:hypothetical protein
MSVYVDDMRRPARVGRLAARWSHLFADTRDELDAFAAELGLRPAWIQHPGTHREHYDLTDARRAAALRRGAIPITYPHGTAELIARRHAGN